jgi:hypothetical protein
MELLTPHKVQFSREEIRLFNSVWPCSTLRATRSYWFEFADNGDLIDTDVPEHDDGDAATALASDAWQWLGHDTTPDWL